MIKDQIINNISQTDQFVKQENKEELNEYVDLFVQRLPRYAVKSKKSWITKKKPLSDIPVYTHLENGKYAVGTLGKWYPSYALLDLDDIGRDKVEKIREEIGLNVENSMLFNSESKNSYHILFKPSYADKPPTLRLLNEVFKPFILQNQIELYPQPAKVVRLPFGKFSSRALDYEYRNLTDWQEKLYWFNKLDDFDLSTIPYYKEQKPIKTLEYPDFKQNNANTYTEGKFFYERGLISQNSRHDSEWKVIYYLFRQNIPIETTIDMTFSWIKQRHNGFSKDILTNPRKVKAEIERQAQWIYTNFESKNIYPDSIHNSYLGYIAKADIEHIVRLTKGNIPQSKFYFNLIKYCYPRRHRDKINIHSDHLTKWSEKNYLKYIEDLKKANIIKTRSDSFKIDEFSKAIKINYKFKSPDEAILIDGRAPDSLADTIKAAFEIDEFMSLLKKTKLNRQTISEIIKRIFLK